MWWRTFKKKDANGSGELQKGMNSELREISCKLSEIICELREVHEIRCGISEVMGNTANWLISIRSVVEVAA